MISKLSVVAEIPVERSLVIKLRRINLTVIMKKKLGVTKDPHKKALS